MKSVPCAGVRGKLPTYAAASALPYDPSPYRLSGELGGGLLPATESNGSFCVGSIMCATRVCTRPEVGSPNHSQISAQNVGAPGQPSPVKLKLNAAPEEMPFDAYEATLAQSTVAFSALFRGQ